jgi:hypothetical protein
LWGLVPSEAQEPRRVEEQNTVVRLDPALDALIAPGSKAELLKGDY